VSLQQTGNCVQQQTEERNKSQTNQTQFQSHQIPVNLMLFSKHGTFNFALSNKLEANSTSLDQLSTASLSHFIFR
jgi:hypothetical protein